MTLISVQSQVIMKFFLERVWNWKQENTPKIHWITKATESLPNAMIRLGNGKILSSVCPTFPKFRAGKCTNIPLKS